jgi:hypothetical protein
MAIGPVAVLAFLVRCGSSDSPAPADVGSLSDAASEAVESVAPGDLSGETGDIAPETAGPAFLHLIPGPGEPGFDAALEALAYDYERQFHLFNAYPMALNADLSIHVAGAADRTLVEEFLGSTDSWDFEAETGKKVEDVVTAWHKVAGLYAGAAVAADAFRYGILRDNGYPAAEVERARGFLLADLDALHLATAITGVPGVIARGFMRTDIQGDGVSTVVTPLFDASGNPLPEEKNNGTWRADESGLYPNYIWEDSCSRDMYIGWVAAFAGIWEVIRDDAAFSQDLKDRLRTDALDIVRELMVVRESGYDLEIPDADGRTTYHGYMNENNLDRIYVPGIRNGFYAIMALGCVAGLNYVAEDPEVHAWLYEQLLGPRELHVIAADDQSLVNRGVQSNFSNVNMAFMGAWLSLRYIEEDAAVRKVLVKAVAKALYDDGTPNQPSEMKQSFLDFTYAAGAAGATAGSPAVKPFDPDAVANGLQTLSEFPKPPYWELGADNCDETEIAAGVCTLNDGTQVTLAGNQGWGDNLVASSPIPMKVRHPSNYHWRSNPYEPNGFSDGTRMLPGADFRWAYWMGRWVRVKVPE